MEFHLAKWKLATGLALAAATACSKPAVIIDNYPAAYALLYGTVRLASHAPAANALVRAGSGLGVRTDSAGQYRLPTSINGISPGTFPLDVKVFRVDSQGRLVDSMTVRTQVPFSSTQPPLDSARVDVLLPWS